VLARHLEAGGSSPHFREQTRVLESPAQIGPRRVCSRSTGAGETRPVPFAAHLHSDDAPSGQAVARRAANGNLPAAECSAPGETSTSIQVGKLYGSASCLHFRHRLLSKANALMVGGQQISSSLMPWVARSLKFFR